MLLVYLSPNMELEPMTLRTGVSCFTRLSMLAVSMYFVFLKLFRYTRCLGFCGKGVCALKPNSSLLDLMKDDGD